MGAIVDAPLDAGTQPEDASMNTNTTNPLTRLAALNQHAEDLTRRIRRTRTAQEKWRLIHLRDDLMDEIAMEAARASFRSNNVSTKTA